MREENSIKNIYGSRSRRSRDLKKGGGISLML